MPRYYTLDTETGEPVPVNDVLVWAQAFETENRVVLQEYAARRVLVSTVFLGLDHGHWFFDGRPHDPVLWETMIFGGPFDGFQDRYSSRLDALRGHALAVALVEAYRATPRKTKCALQKWGAAFDTYPLRPDERRRLHRALTRIGWRTDREAI